MGLKTRRAPRRDPGSAVQDEDDRESRQESPTHLHVFIPRSFLVLESAAWIHQQGSLSLPPKRNVSSPCTSNSISLKRSKSPDLFEKIWSGCLLVDRENASIRSSNTWLSAMPREADIISTLRRRAKRSAKVRTGIGDDAAIFEAMSGKDVVVCSDLLVEGVHFKRGWSRLMGQKALAVNLSDVAAMGAVPLYALL